MKHTKGPWHLGAGNCTGRIFTDAEGQRMRLEEGGTTLYPICQIVHGWNEEEDEANARLIAAAPELLAALDQLLEWAEKANSRLNYERDGPLQFGGNPHLNPCFKNVRAAIARATGDTP